MDTEDGMVHMDSETSTEEALRSAIQDDDDLASAFEDTRRRLRSEDRAARQAFERSRCEFDNVVLQDVVMPHGHWDALVAHMDHQRALSNAARERARALSKLIHALRLRERSNRAKIARLMMEAAHM